MSQFRQSRSPVVLDLGPLMPSKKTPTSHLTPLIDRGLGLVSDEKMSQLLEIGSEGCLINPKQAFMLNAHTALTNITEQTLEVFDKRLAMPWLEEDWDMQPRLAGAPPRAFSQGGHGSVSSGRAPSQSGRNYSNVGGSTAVSRLPSSASGGDRHTESSAASDASEEMDAAQDRILCANCQRGEATVMRLCCGEPFLCKTCEAWCTEDEIPCLNHH